MKLTDIHDIDQLVLALARVDYRWVDAQDLAEIEIGGCFCPDVYIPANGKAFLSVHPHGSEHGADAALQVLFDKATGQIEFLDFWEAYGPSFDCLAPDSDVTIEGMCAALNAWLTPSMELGQG